MAQVEQAALKTLFTEARSQNGWLDIPVSDAELEAAYDIAKWGPTSMNTQPMRLLFLRTAEDRERLRSALSPGNVAKVMAAPVVALICYDAEFHAKLAETFPHNPSAKGLFDANPDLAAATAFRNSSLQAGYYMLALRAVGLDVGPMSGFDAAAVDSEFLEGTAWRVNLICGIGHGDPTKTMPRLPRLGYADVVKNSAYEHGKA